MAIQQSLVHGSKEPPLCDLTLGQLFDRQASSHGGKHHILSPWQNVQLTYSDVAERSKTIAQALLNKGLQYGDRIGIFAGNCHQYLEVVLAAGRIGCPSVSFNTTYTPLELSRATKFTECKAVFTAAQLGPRDLTQHIKDLSGQSGLKHIVIIDKQLPSIKSSKLQLYDQFTNIEQPDSDRMNPTVAEIQARVKSANVLNIQFTSGTTGNPKAASLTHCNLINNAFGFAHMMGQSSTDTTICAALSFTTSAL